ncbi:hypothetical protein H5410_055909 [Solanum commersonii]|uniref:Uncharacterized protein n=1 Tax=Solanum commersonii TaxID=4109 RepID=A0A9J5WKJ9_SOLCO|nr:hypothetical protein H5410_055909 [Solanum commersonii]
MGHMMNLFSLKNGKKMDTKDVMRNFSSKATSIKVPLLKSAIQHDATSSKSSHFDGSFNNWRVPSSNIGNVCYTPGYWEWVEDVLPRHKEILELIKVYDVVYTSLFTYDYADNILHAFCELWRPSANTLCTFVHWRDVHITLGLTSHWRSTYPRTSLYRLEIGFRGILVRAILTPGPEEHELSSSCQLNGLTQMYIFPGANTGEKPKCSSLIRYIMNISILLRHSGVWESEVRYERYRSDGIVVGENISFMNMVSVIAAELNIDVHRKYIAIRYIVEGNSCPLIIRNDMGVKLYVEVKKCEDGFGEIVCVEGPEKDAYAINLVESENGDSCYIPELEAYVRKKLDIFKVRYFNSEQTCPLRDRQLTNVQTTVGFISAATIPKLERALEIIRGKPAAGYRELPRCTYMLETVPIVVVEGAHLDGAYKGTFVQASTLDGADYYKPAALANTYEVLMVPMPGEEDWIVLKFVLEEIVMPPWKKRLAERPRKIRKKNPNAKISTNTNRCGRC